MRDALRTQDKFQIGVGEGAVAGLVDDDVLRRDVDLGHDLEAGTGPQQDVGAVETGALAAPFFVSRHVGHVGPVALPGVDDPEAGRACCRDQPALS